MHRMILRFALTFLFTITIASLAQAAPTSIGSVTNVTFGVDPTNGDRYVEFWTSDGGQANVSAYADDVIRVQAYDTALWPKEEPMIAASLGMWPAESMTFTTNITGGATNYVMQTALLTVTIQGNPFAVTFVDKLAGYTLAQDDPVNSIQFDPSYNIVSDQATNNNFPFNLPQGISKLKCSKVVPANQAFFGLGEYNGASNRRGLNFTCWNYQDYTWSVPNPMYLNIPFIYGVQPANGSTPAFTYGIFFDNPCRATYRLGTASSTSYSFEAADGQMDYYFFGGGTNHTMKAVMDKYTELTGRPAMLPKWAMGHQLSRFSYMDQTWATQWIASTAVASNIPLDAIYLDIDYMNVNADGNPTAANVLHQLTMNKDWPNPPQLISTCLSNGVHVIPLIEPLLETDDPYYSTEAGDLDFIKDNSGAEYSASIYLGPVSWFDYSSSFTTNRWIGDMTNWFNTVPFGGIWNDLAEPEDDGHIPLNGLLYDDGAFGVTNGGGADTRRE
jgi:alpha-glucosidase (family GH31 glycosyl hydrolase)